MKVLLYTVDAFTEVPFSGNPAAVCLIGAEFPQDLVMQSLAAEVNLSETAFIVADKGDYKHEGHFKLRWFTPTNEVPLCGHATLASAAVLFKAMENTNTSVSFSTLSGDLHARNECDGFITLDLPQNEPFKCKSCTEYSKLFDAVFSSSTSSIDEVWLSNSTKKLLVRMKEGFTRQALENLQPDFDLMMAQHDGSIYKGVIVTLKGGQNGDNKYDFLSRYFAPWNGIPEDSVTGSAHTVLAPFWGKVCKKREMLGRQCSKRGGDVKVKLMNDDRVSIGGPAVLVIKGSINIP